MKEIKVKDVECGQIKCKNCPLCVKLCQTFINGRSITIGAIIERMYSAKRLTDWEYRNAKQKSEKTIEIY